MKNRLVIVNAHRIDSETESVSAKQYNQGVWLFKLEQDAADLAAQSLGKLSDLVKENIHTVIVCNACEDSYARNRCVITDGRIRPRDVLGALGTTLTLSISECLPNVQNIFKIDAACASGLYALEIAASIARDRDVMVLIAGVDKSTAPYFVNMFRNISALSQSPDQYHTPFNQERSGFAMGEGAAMLAVTTEQRAHELGLHVEAYVDAISTKTIGTHGTDPSDQPALTQFIQDTIVSSGKTLDEFAYWDAHGTATPVGDQAEYEIFNKIFANKTTALSSFKGRIGHCMGASALIELVHGIEQLQNQTIPANYQLTNPLARDSRLLTEPSFTDKKTFIKTSFGFAGRNAVAVITVT